MRAPAPCAAALLQRRSGDGRCCGRCHPHSSSSPTSHAKKGCVGLPRPKDLPRVRLQESATDANGRQGREQKRHTKATLTATSFSGDTLTPFTSSSSGSSFSLLSVQETESWTEQVLSKSGKLVDGYFRKSPSADSYPRDNKICYIGCRKLPKSRWNCSISPAQWELPGNPPLITHLHVLKLLWSSYKKQTWF